MRLSVIIPAFNEKANIEEVLRRLGSVGLEMQVIVVDDGSTDGTRELLEGWREYELLVVSHSRNRGKGAAVRTGLAHATGDIVVIQDADLEYDPQDFHAMLEPIRRQGAQVVYGSRILNADNPRGGLRFYAGGRLVTLATNLLYGCRLTDEPTCYKMFRSDVLRRISIESDGFEWEPEVTAKILKQGIRIVEVPISYAPRSVAEGKKIKARDGALALWTLLRQRWRP